MKIVLISPGGSIHTRRWANGISRRGHEVCVVSLHDFLDSFDPEVRKFRLPFNSPLGYFLNKKYLFNLLKEIGPDIVNTHYASGYGFLSRGIEGYPYLLSVWGSDVFEFPERSYFHRLVLIKNLLSAHHIASTSLVMRQRVLELVPDLNVSITPFGVDLKSFEGTCGAKRNSNSITIGTIKALDLRYGIDILIRAFSICINQLQSEFRVRLVIVGGGPQEALLKKLVYELGLDSVVTFVGRVNHEQVPAMLKDFDIFVALSRSESFGVSILEAGASGLPVIVSDAPGLKEVTNHRQTGFVVPIGDVQAAADALIRLVQDPLLRNTMGTMGLKHVRQNYGWDSSLDKMFEAYDSTIQIFNA
jgi:glycosyltransferase involved in cell wall biosynthesis